MNISVLFDMIERGVEIEKLWNIRRIKHNDLVLLHYTRNAVIEDKWPWVERICRGLILNPSTREIVALPFEKFFNWNQGGRVTSAPLREVTTKMDGSLGILYRENGEHKIATKQSFTSDQALWATEWLNKHVDVSKIPDNLTLLFEIIYPENRIVVDYKGKSELVLIGCIDRFTGQDYWMTEFLPLAKELNLSTPKMWFFRNIDELIDATREIEAAEMEGFVARFKDGQRFKFKGDDYLRVHRMLYNMSPKRIYQYMLDGSLPDYIEGIPDEFLPRILSIVSRIENHALEVVSECTKANIASELDQDRASFAQWVVKNIPKRAMPVAFAMYDGKDTWPIALRAIRDKVKEIK